MAHILIVEDYESLRDIYNSVLTQEGHEVVVVNDGFAALERTKKSQFDLIVLDLLLPHMSGIEFLRAFDLKQHPETKVIICSNFDNPNLMQEAEELGAILHFTKSNLSPKQLARVITETLKGPQP